MDGFARNHLIEVTDLAHELRDAFSLDEDLVLGAGEFGFGVECSLAPGDLNTVMLVFGALIKAAGDGVGGGLNQGLYGVETGLTTTPPGWS